MFNQRLFQGMIVLVLFMSIALAACAPQNELPPEVSTAAVASAQTEVPAVAVTSALPEVPTATTASASPKPPESPLPIAAWDLDGDGTASAGNSALEFSGAYKFSDIAVALDGYTGNGSTAAPGPIDTTASFSVSAWVNYAARNINTTSVAVGELGEVTSLFLLGVGDPGQWMFGMKTEDRTGIEYMVRALGDQSVPSKSWTHLVGIYDKDAGMLHLYVNGEPQAEAAFTAPLKANGPLTVGRGQFDSHPGNFWPGSIGEVVVYQAALTAEQVAEIYRTTEPYRPPPPQPAPDPSTYGDGVLNGTWDFVVSDEDFRQFILSDYGVTADEVRIRLGFNNHQWYETKVFDGEPFIVNGVPEGDGGTFRIEDDRLIQIGAQGQGQATLSWVLDGDQLTLTFVEMCAITPNGLNCTDDRSQMDPIAIQVMEHTYTKSGDDGSY